MRTKVTTDEEERRELQRQILSPFVVLLIDIIGTNGEDEDTFFFLFHSQIRIPVVLMGL